MNLIEQIDLRFRSGNSIPIERAHVTAEEWTEIRAFIFLAEEAQTVMAAALSRIKGE